MPVGFGPDKNTLYVIGNHNANAARFTKLDLATMKEEVIAGDTEYDVSGAMVDDEKRIPLAVSFTKVKTEWKILDAGVKADFDVLAKVRDGEFTVASKTTDDKTWIVSYVVDDGPGIYIACNRP